MKKLILISALTIAALGVKTADAQLRVGVSINLGGPVYVPAPPPPPAEPVYNDYDEYYYLPEVEAYYSVPQHCYYYNDGYSWVSAAYLPGYYRNFDWRTARRYEIRGNRPFLRHDNYRARFGGYSNRADFYARAFPGRNNRDPRFDRGPQRNDNRGNWGGQRDNHYNHDRENAYNQGGNRSGNYGQPQGGRGNWGGQQQQQQGGYGQQGQDRGQGNWGQQQGGRGNNQGQPANQGNYGQPQGDRGQGRDGGQGREGRSGNQDRGNYGGGQQHFADRVGVANGDRVANNRPGRL